MARLRPNIVSHINDGITAYLASPLQPFVSLEVPPLQFWRSCSFAGWQLRSWCRTKLLSSSPNEPVTKDKIYTDNQKFIYHNTPMLGFGKWCVMPIEIIVKIIMSKFSQWLCKFGPNLRRHDFFFKSAGFPAQFMVCSEVGINMRKKKLRFKKKERKHAND